MMWVVRTDISARQRRQGSVKTVQRGTPLSIKPTSTTGETRVNRDPQCPGITGNIPNATESLPFLLGMGKSRQFTTRSERTHADTVKMVTIILNPSTYTFILDNVRGVAIVLS